MKSWNGVRAWMAWVMWGMIALLAGCGGGSGSSGDEAPMAAIRTTAQVLSADPVTLQVTRGSEVTLDGGASSGTDRQLAWTLESRPAGSVTTLLGDPAQAVVRLVPDLAGRYDISLRVTDGSGRTSRQVATLTVTERGTVSAIAGTVTFLATADTRPTQAVTVGSMIALDGSASAGPDGAAVTLAWDMAERPATSGATLAVRDRLAHFTADVAGTYRLRVRGTDATGRTSEVIHVYQAVMPASQVTVAASVSVPGGSSSLQAGTGHVVVLDATASRVPAGSSGVPAWQILARPAGSAAALALDVGYATSFSPDVAGLYVVEMTLADSTTGLQARHTVTVEARQGLTAVVTGISAPVPLISGPAMVGAPGVPVTLRGSGSHDPAGTPILSWQWVLRDRPAASAASLATSDQPDLVFTPDVEGRYEFELRVTGEAGRNSTRLATLLVGNLAPVVVLERTQVATMTGQPVALSAASSVSQSGKPLSYRWTVDARPAGSVAEPADPAAAATAFTPDAAGTYHLAVTVTEGAIRSVAGVTLTAYTSEPDTVRLAYAPQFTAWSRGLGLAAITSQSPATLHLVNPAVPSDVAVALPALAKGLSLSPDGRLAAVLHEGTVSLVDLASATILRSSGTSGSQTEGLVDDAGRIYLTGQTGGSWVTPAFTVLDGRTGATLQTVTSVGSIYGTTRAVLADVPGRIFTVSSGLSPVQVYGYAVDPATGLVGAATGSPYWGDYAMNAPFWLSRDQSMLFTGSGTYFRTADLTYAGTLGTQVLSVSQSAGGAETVAFESSSDYPYASDALVYTYPSALRRHTGALLFRAADVPLPKVHGQDAYGLRVFHDAGDRRVMLVQTGSARSDATGVAHYLIRR